MAEDYSRFLENKKVQLQQNIPFTDGVWNKEFLYEY